jgi:predicted phosphodiesterase
MRLVCISDIHGNASALQSALALGEMHQCPTVLVAGDLCFPGPEPLRVWKMLMAARAHCVQGLTDRALATLDPDKLTPQSEQERERVGRLRACREELGTLIVARLAKLPKTFWLSTENGAEILLVHGCPQDPTLAMTHDMSDEELREHLGDDPPPVVICGASHVPFDRQVGPTRVINVGSVGDAPGGLVAHVTLVQTSPGGVEVRSLTTALDRPEPR